MTNMKLQWIYYYNNLIPIILQSILMKNMKKKIYLLQWKYRYNNLTQIILSIICNLLQ